MDNTHDGLIRGAGKHSDFLHVYFVMRYFISFGV